MAAGMEIVNAAALFATPVLVAAVGELIVERAGVVNIGIEGMMLAGALAAWVGNGYGGAGWGFAAAVAAAIVLALIFALAALLFAADQIVAGTGINLLAFGATALLYKRVNASMADKVITATDPRWMMAALVVLVVVAWLFLRYTRWGLELTAIGEAPQAADSAGVAVGRRKLAAILFGGRVRRPGGRLPVDHAGAAVHGEHDRGERIPGPGDRDLWPLARGGNPVGGPLLRGRARGANLLETRSGYGGASLQLLKAVPYVVSLLALAGVAGRSGAPAALGRAYVRE